MAGEQRNIPRGARSLVVIAMKNSQLMQGFRHKDREDTIKEIDAAFDSGVKRTNIDCIIDIGVQTLAIIWENVSSYYVTDIPIESQILIPEVMPPKDLKIIQ